MSEGDKVFSQYQPSPILRDMESTIQDLPDEMLLCIFEYISPIELSMVVAEVCQQWQRIIDHQIVRVKSLGQLEALHDGLKAVIVTQPVLQLDKASKLLGYVVDLVPKLQELTISKDYPLKKRDLKTLLCMKQLKHLDVFTRRQYFNRSLSVNPSITTLVVNESICSGFLLNLASTNKLTGYHMYGRSEYYLGNEIMVFLHLQAAHLRELTLRCFHFIDEYSALNCCIDLESLQLHQCTHLSVRGMMQLFELRYLKRLHLTGTQVRCKDFLQIIKYLPRKIEDLNLSSSCFADDYCDPLALRLPNLKILELWCCQVSNDSLLRLVQGLNELEVLDTDVCFDQHHISAMEKHQSLRKLRCQWSEPITTKLDITKALAVEPKEYLQKQEEGPSADVFYFWSRGVNLKTFSSKDYNEIDETI